MKTLDERMAREGAPWLLEEKLGPRARPEGARRCAP
jgi:hypothetical protein